MPRHLQRRLFIIIWLLCAGLATHGTFAGTGDEPHYLAIAHSIAFDRDLNLANNYGGNEPLIAGGSLQPDHHIARGSNGVARPVHDVGMPLLFAPYVRIMAPAVAWIAPRLPSGTLQRFHLTPSVIYRHTLSAAMMVFAASLGVLMANLFVEVGTGERTAFWMALLIALSPPLLIFAILFFTEIISALLCAALFRKIVFNSPSDAAWTWALTGIATGFAVLVHVRNVGLALSLGLLAVLRLSRRHDAGRVVFYVTGAVLMLALRTTINHHMWGTWITTPHARVGEWQGVGSVLFVAMGRLGGLFLDQEYGLLPYAPVFMLAIFGVPRLVRMHTGPAIAIAFVVGCYLLSIILPVSNPHGWTGGWSPAARFLVPIVPLLAIAAAAGFMAAPRPIAVSFVVIQVVFSAFVWQHPKLLWNDGTGLAAVCKRYDTHFCDHLPSFVAVP